MDWEKLKQMVADHEAGQSARIQRALAEVAEALTEVSVALETAHARVREALSEFEPREDEDPYEWLAEVKRMFPEE